MRQDAHATRELTEVSEKTIDLVLETIIDIEDGSDANDFIGNAHGIVMVDLNLNGKESSNNGRGTKISGWWNESVSKNKSGRANFYDLGVSDSSLLL